MIIKLKLSTDKWTEDSQAVMSNTGILCNLWTPWSRQVALLADSSVNMLADYGPCTLDCHISRLSVDLSIGMSVYTPPIWQPVLIGKFCIPDGSGMSTIARLVRVNFFAKTKTNIGNLLLSHWKTKEILKIVTFQNLNFISKSKGYLLQTTKLWEKLIVYLTEERIRRWTQKKKT